MLTLHCSLLAEDLAEQIARQGRGEATLQLAPKEGLPGLSRWLRLEVMRPFWGGLRWWIRCDCGRRGALLYLPHGETSFACRTCHRLGYVCQRENHRPNAFERHCAVQVGADPRDAWRVLRRQLRGHRYGLPCFRS